jgi:hypothetical protein
LLRHEETLHHLTNDGERVEFRCRIDVGDGPYEMGTEINGTVEFTATQNLSISEYTLQAICYVGKTLPFDRVATEFPLKVFTCQANSTISIPFSFNLPICVPSYRGPYPFEVSWYIALYHSEVPTGIQIELPVNAAASQSFTPEWMKPATANIFSWGVLFWVVIAGLGWWIFPLALDELRRESKDPVGIIFSVLFCLAALGLPEILFRLYTRFFRLIILPFDLLVKLFGKKLFKFDRSIIIEGIRPGASHILNVTSKLKEFTVQVIGASYWGYGSGVKIKKLKNRSLYSFFPIYFESRKKFYSSECKIDAATPKHSEDISERILHLHLNIPQDAPFSYVKGLEGTCWELVFTWELLGIPFSVHYPLRLVPRTN